MEKSLREGCLMTLMRGFAKVDEQGRIAIPDNIRRQIGLEVGQTAEFKVAGPQKSQYLVLHKRDKTKTR